MESSIDAIKFQVDIFDPVLFVKVILTVDIVEYISVWLVVFTDEDIVALTPILDVKFVFCVLFWLLYYLSPFPKETNI